MKIFSLILSMMLICSPCFATWSARNLVSGAAGNGNVLSNTAYMWADRYTCADPGWTAISQTCQNVLLFQAVGADDQKSVPNNVSPVGDIVMRTYTASTNTMASSTSTVWTDPSFGVGGGLWVRRNPGESFFRVYFPEYNRSTAAAVNNLFMIKSTDLTGTSWSSPVVAITTVSGVNPFCWLNSPNAGQYYFLIAGASSGKTVLYLTTDNGDTFSQYSTIPNTTTNTIEGMCVNDPSGTGEMICIYRTNLGSGNFLLETTSPDWGLTWTNLFSTGLGAATGAKVTPNLIPSAGGPLRITAYFYDRGDNRLKISGPTLFSNAYNNNWIPIYLLGTSSQGNEGIFAIDYANHKYVMSTPTGTEPTNAMNWWVGKDIYATDKLGSSKLGSFGTQ